MRKKLALAMVGIMASSSAVSLAVAPAHAESNSVTINKIGNKVAKDDTGTDSAKVSVEPSVSTTGKVKVTDKSIVLLDSNDNASSDPQPSLLLGAGSYRLKMDATYKTYTVRKNGARVYSGEKHQILIQSLQVFRPCATKANFDTVKRGDTLAVVKTKLHQGGEGVSGSKTSISYAYLVCDVEDQGPGDIGVTYSVKNRKAHKMTSKSYNVPQPS